MKVGRNEPCHCGSGKKFKRCHGAVNAQAYFTTTTPEIQARMDLAADVVRAAQQQRQKAQGLGKPIISGEMEGTRFVAVGNKLHYSKNWKTFHDFLSQRLKDILGTEWGEAERAKRLSDRHPILVWFHHMALLMEGRVDRPGKVHSSPMTGAAAAWLNLAYDLYALDHNAELQVKLVHRIKMRDSFPGARYEASVAAVFIRAGFTIEFENEDDRGSTHCEFTATCTRSGKKYSVEAKHRNPDDNMSTGMGRFKLGKRLNKALRKSALHPRIVFIDINVPDDARNTEIPSYLTRALSDIRKFEGRVSKGKSLPPAYLFVTNRPYEHALDGTLIRSSVMAEGFQIPDFKMDTAFPSIRAAFEARKAHVDMHELLNSIRDHSEVPSTFDGEAPELAFGENQPPRLTVGKSYMVRDSDGVERPGVLEDALVTSQEGDVMGIYSLENGKRVMVRNRLTESEFAAYRRNPSTFFGVVKNLARKCETPLQWFDFFYESNQGTSKELLLQGLSGAPDFEKLQHESQAELAIV